MKSSSTRRNELSKLFSYTMKADTGFAPHIDESCKYLSLACCKPEIRNSAEEGDWVIGSGGQELTHRSGVDVQLNKKGPAHKKFDLDTHEGARRFIEHLDRNFKFNHCSNPTEKGTLGSCKECE